MQPPKSIICFARTEFSSGNILFNPEPITAIVLPEEFLEFSWATVSIPRANPLMIDTP